MGVCVCLCVCFTIYLVLQLINHIKYTKYLNV